METLKNDESIFFYKIENGKIIKTKDYVYLGDAKGGKTIKVKKAYYKHGSNIPIIYKNQRIIYIDKSFLNTTSLKWRETINKPEYFIRIE